MLQKIFPVFIAIATSLLFTGCQKEAFTITGHITGYKDGTKIALQSSDEMKIIDHGKIQDDAFEFDGVITDGPENLIVLITDGDNTDYFSLFIDNENVVITADKKDLPYDVKITGSAYNDEYEKLNAMRRQSMKDRDKLSGEYFAIKEEVRKVDSIDNKYWGDGGKFTKIDNRIDSLTKKYITENLNTHGALDNFIRMRNVFTRQEAAALYAQLKPEFKNGQYGKAINSYLKKPELKEGDTAYNFEAEDSEGNKHKLYDYLNKKKYVLLDFSTPHCSWCKKALPILKEMHDGKKRQLQIVSLSVDKNREDWIEETEDEELEYVRLYTKEARYSEPYLQYNINATPTFILISPDGKIITKIEGYSYTLKQDIYALIEKK